MNKALIILWLLLGVVTTQMACGPKSFEIPAKIDFGHTLTALTVLDNSLASANSTDSLSIIDDLAKSLAQSFPLRVPFPFSLHSLQNLLMKNTQAIKAKADKQLTLTWQSFLDEIDNKIVFHNNMKFPIDTSILELVLLGHEPMLKVQLRDDFSHFTKAELKERNIISWESFWQAPFLYSSDSGYSAEKDTGAVLVTDEGNLVGLLEFKNKLATPKPVDLENQSDLINVVQNTPGYVSSVGRRAAYARFDIGKKMFDKFFEYARDNKIAQSFLHVREDNTSAIKLYESLGYKNVASVPNYYQSNPPIGAYVLLKKF
jgi:ribosomal protein S18 acetylase RimI-like enzyme